jgi:hypothetical protein
MKTDSINVSRNRNGLHLLITKYTTGTTMRDHIKNPKITVTRNIPNCLNSPLVSLELAIVLASKLATPTGVKLKQR